MKLKLEFLKELGEGGFKPKKVLREGYGHFLQLQHTMQFHSHQSVLLMVVIAFLRALTLLS